MQLFRENIRATYQFIQPEGNCVNACVVSDVGLIRGNNEDNYILDTCMNVNADRHIQAQTTFEALKDQWHLFGVFDGMGGGEKGEIASGTTAKVFKDAWLRASDCADKTEIDNILRKSFLDSNNEIVHLQRKFKIYGTTGTVICTNSEEFKIYHLGDSRAYLLRDGQLFRLTKDQTLAQMKIDVGLYEASDPQAEMERHKLTEYIGRDWTKENLSPVESEWIPIEPNDRILLCSDGLYDMCTDTNIAEILKSLPMPATAAKNLVQAALANGGEDNITCVVLSF